MGTFAVIQIIILKGLVQHFAVLTIGSDSAWRVAMCRFNNLSLTNQRDQFNLFSFFFTFVIFY